jgi:hypothetical protein
MGHQRLIGTYKPIDMHTHLYHNMATHENHNMLIHLLIAIMRLLFVSVHTMSIYGLQLTSGKVNHQPSARTLNTMNALTRVNVKHSTTSTFAENWPKK